jgi:hypothetical protein
MYSIIDLLAINPHYLLKSNLVQQEISMIKFIVRYPFVLLPLFKPPILLR